MFLLTNWSFYYYFYSKRTFSEPICPWTDRLSIQTKTGCFRSFSSRHGSYMHGQILCNNNTYNHRLTKSFRNSSSIYIYTTICRPSSSRIWSQLLRFKNSIRNNFFHYITKNHYIKNGVNWLYYFLFFTASFQGKCVIWSPLKFSWWEN